MKNETKESEKIFKIKEDGTIDYFQEDGQIVNYKTWEELVICLHNNKLQCLELVKLLRG